jgi:hypothetical protein
MSGRAEHSRATLAVIGAAVVIGVISAVLLAAGRLGGRADAVERPTVADQMRALRNPPIEEARLPEVVRQAQNQIDGRGPREIVRGQARLLVHDLGVNRVGIYALPTVGGNVCVVVSEATYAATCVDSFDRGTGNVQPMIYSGVSSPVTVVGLAADSATDVKVVAGGSPQDATLKDNSFFWQADAELTRDDIKGLLVRQADGGVVSINLDFGR